MILIFIHSIMSTFSHFLPARIGRCFATLSEKVAITSDAFIDMSSYFDMSNFSTLDIKCSFLQVREESGLPVRLFKNKFTPQKQNEMFQISILFAYVY